MVELGLSLTCSRLGQGTICWGSRYGSNRSDMPNVQASRDCKGRQCLHLRRHRGRFEDISGARDMLLSPLDVGKKRRLWTSSSLPLRPYTLLGSVAGFRRHPTPSEVPESFRCKQILVLLLVYALYIVWSQVQARLMRITRPVDFFVSQAPARTLRWEVARSFRTWRTGTASLILATTRAVLYSIHYRYYRP